MVSIPKLTRVVRWGLTAQPNPNPIAATSSFNLLDVWPNESMNEILCEMCVKIVLVRWREGEDSLITP